MLVAGGVNSRLPGFNRRILSFDIADSLYYCPKGFTQTLAHNVEVFTREFFCTYWSSNFARRILFGGFRHGPHGSHLCYLDETGSIDL